ncbi:MAG: TolC family protein [Blastocatellia bacterium]|nr:TolC family protein [Blastocatellia bacterium]
MTRGGIVRSMGALLAAFLLSVCLAAPGRAGQETVASASEENDKRRQEQEALIRSVRDALRRRLSDAEQPQFLREAPAEEGAASVDPQSGRNPQAQPAPPQKRSQPLTLEELINFVDLYHPKIRGLDAERRIASAKRLEKQGAFDPIFSTGTDWLRYNTEFDSKTRRGKVASMQLADAGVEMLTRYGIKIAAGARYNLGKVKSPLSPTGNGGEYFLDFKIPFFRGARINEKVAAERQAFLGEPLADAEFRLSRLELILKAANNYWEWVAAKRKLDVARQLLDLARFRAGAVRERVTAGDLPQIDSVEAELEVQRRQGAIVKADRDLQKAAFKLSLFLWSPNGLPAPIPEEGNVPATTPPPVIFTDDQSSAGQRLALERRPELKMVSLGQEITRIDLDLARNQRLPAIDLALSPGRDTGFGGIGNTFKAGLNLTLPLRQRTADGRISASTLKLEKLDFELTLERQRIATEVLDAVSAINTSHDRYRAAQQEVELAQRLEEGERTRFTLGDSTLFLVNQRERATAEARVKLIEIQAEYEQAVAAFRTITVQY